MKTYPSDLSKNVKLLGNYQFNVYLIKGHNASAIVETGVSGTVDLVISQLQALGESPGYIIVTHPHSDHITGFDGLMKRFPEASVITGEGAKEFIEHPKALSAILLEDKYMSTMLDKFGSPPARPPINTAPDLSESIPVSNTTLEIDLGGITLDCFTVKGHSPGNIAVNIAEDKTLLVSDSLGFHFPERGFCPLFFTGYSRYIETIKLLKSFKPRSIGPGHQGPMIGPDVEKAFEQSLDTAQKTAAIVNKPGMSSDETAHILFKKYYVDEFTLYSEKNIMNCMKLLVRRAKE